jgi:hypothetical protein
MAFIINNIHSVRNRYFAKSRETTVPPDARRRAEAMKRESSGESEDTTKLSR